MGPHRPHGRLRKLGPAAAFAMAALWSALAFAAGEMERQLQLEILINGERSGLIGTFVQRSDGTIAARRSELIEAGVKVPGSGQPDETVVLNALLGAKFH